MKNREPITAFSPHEVNRFLAPLALASMVFMVFIILNGVLQIPGPNPYMISYGILGMIYISIYSVLIARSIFFRYRYGWFHSVMSGIGLGLLTYILPDNLHVLFHLMLIFGVIGTATISGRYQT